MTSFPLINILGKQFTSWYARNMSQCHIFWHASNSNAVVSTCVSISSLVTSAPYHLHHAIKWIKHTNGIHILHTKAYIVGACIDGTIVLCNNFLTLSNFFVLLNVRKWIWMLFTYTLHLKIDNIILWFVTWNNSGEIDLLHIPTPTLVSTHTMFIHNTT